MNFNIYEKTFSLLFYVYAYYLHLNTLIYFLNLDSGGILNESMLKINVHN